jgi:hypothetical protein
MAKLAACICRQCASTFYYSASGVQRGRGQFCSRQCSSDHKRGRHSDHAKTPHERYEKYVVRRDGGQCWSWTGFKHKGYGRIKGRTNVIGAHRISYEKHIGPIPKGMTVLHKCDNPECTNPEHLTVGTNADNNLDRDRKGRAARGSRAGRAVLTEGLVLMMRQAYFVNGESLTSISRRFGINKSTTVSATKGRTWRHLP